MNKNDAKDFLPLVQALAEGKTIQYWSECETKWMEPERIHFSGPVEKYRIKPEPEEIWRVSTRDGSFWYKKTRKEAEELEKELIRKYDSDSMIDRFVAAEYK